jgi:hypothetical protein
MGAARFAVGVALMAAPGAALRVSRREQPTGAAVLLMRTIGIRDMVLGLGTIVSAQSGDDAEIRRWLKIGLTSDSLDVVTGLLSARAIGSLEAAFAAGSAATFVALDRWAIGSLDPTT